MAVIDLIDALRTLADWPEAPRGRNGPVRGAVGWIVLGLGCDMASLGGAALLIGAFGAASLSAYLAFASSVFALLAAAALALFVFAFVASLIAVGVDRLTRSQ